MTPTTLRRRGTRSRSATVVLATCVLGASTALTAVGAPASAAPAPAAPALAPAAVQAAVPGEAPAAVRAAVQPPGGVRGVKVPRIRWTSAGGRFQRATVAVPYDYRKVAGKTFPLHVVRLPATDRRHRLGSLVFNFGGPGAGAADTILDSALFLPASVRARYDIVGVDPRGTGRSKPVRCSRSAAQQAGEPLTGWSDFPETAAERKAARTQVARLALRCRTRNHDLLDHVGTLQFARDLDVLRAAMGDKRLNFYGLSYGTFLGQVLVNTFPTRVGAVVLDGVVNPGWAAGPAGTVSWNREGYDLGAWQTTQEFFRRCDAAGARLCAFAGEGKDRYAALAARLRTRPVVVPAGAEWPDFVLDYSQLVVLTQGLLYEPANWPLLGRLLQAAESAKPAAVAAAVREARAALGAAGAAAYDNYPDAALAISCADTENPRDWAQYGKAGLLREAEVAPYFGRRAAYTGFACHAWKGRSTERYTGPWNRRTSSPVLVIGNTFDPATPYDNAVEVAGRLPNSRLLTLDGVGHTALGKSACVMTRVVAYLLKRTLPPQGARCAEDAGPFDDGRAPTRSPYVSPVPIP